MNPLADWRVAAEPFYAPQGGEIELFEAAYAARLPVMLKGPTGCGKSRFVEHMAWKLQRPLVTVACNEDMTAADLVGRFLLEPDGTRWQDGPLTTAARHGAICQYRFQANDHIFNCAVKCGELPNTAGCHQATHLRQRF